MVLDKLFSRKHGGWQFKVDYNNGRVVKQPRTTLGISLKILSDEGLEFLQRDYLSEIRRVKCERDKSLKHLRASEFEPELFAGLRFEGDLIIQDEAEEVYERLQNATLREEKEVIDDYLELTHEAWRYGVHENTFNFSINFGYVNDEMTILDVGELSFSYEDVRKQLENEVWCQRYSFNNHLSEPAQQYFIEEASEDLTPDKLEENWRKNVN